MTPEIHKKYDQIKMVTDMMIPTLSIFRLMKLDDFEELARPFADGTMSLIAAHHMGLKDIEITEKNLTKAIKVLHHLKALQQLLIIEPDAS